ncbi:serine protease, partial [Streptomyces halstedii]|nr:serine protease [Streptomyces halstedii]
MTDSHRPSGAYPMYPSYGNGEGAYPPPPAYEPQQAAGEAPGAGAWPPPPTGPEAGAPKPERRVKRPV